MSHWLTIIRLMNLILTLLLGIQPPLTPLSEMLTSPTARVETPAWVLRSDYGLALTPAKKNRFEKLAAALARQMQH